jgi:hypothetical protein
MASEIEQLTHLSGFLKVTSVLYLPDTKVRTWITN